MEQPEERRNCRKCGPLPLSEFYGKGSKDRNRCKACVRSSTAARREAAKNAGLCILCCRVPPTEGNPTCASCRETNLRRHHANREEYNASSRERKRQLKLAAFLAYGGIVCACCGEKHPKFLTIDHVDGKGAEHRRDLLAERGWSGPPSAMTGAHMYLWLKQQGYPPGFRVLCMNCNFATGHFGACPHGGTVPLEN